MQSQLIASRLSEQSVLCLGSFRMSASDKEEHSTSETSLTISKILTSVGPDESSMSRELCRSLKAWPFSIIALSSPPPSTSSCLTATHCRG